MSTEVLFTIKLKAELRAECTAAAIGEYDHYLYSKIAAARASMRAGRGRSNDQVAATFDAKRKQLTDQT